MLTLTPGPTARAPPPAPQKKTQNKKKKISANVKRRTVVGELEKIIEFIDSSTVY